jgi:acyl-CoA synthetase (NDP forming)
MSARPELEPAVAVSLGNQLDLTISDVVRAVARRGDIDCVGVYAEGFDELDGLECARAVRAARDAGKVVVLYKAGRTPAARAAAEGHTASVAGDWVVCDAALTQSGALVATSFAEFEQLLELSTMLHGKRVTGRRVAAVSNAGFEAVGMADALSGARYDVAMPPPSASTRQKLHDVLTAHGLASLVGPRNPLDLTPMATDEAYEQAVRTLLDAPEFDAVVVGCVPMTPQLRTTPAELREDDSAPAGAARSGRSPSIANRVVALARGSLKPLVFVVDAGPPYDVFAATVRAGGVPVFRSSDQAVAALGRYLCHRAPAEISPS